MYQHGTFMVDQDSYPINRLVDLATEPEITFGKALLEQLEYIWRIRATYPASCIFLYDDGVSGAFNQILMHPDVIGANASLWGPYLIQYVGQHFGGNFCPPNFEPVARARKALAIYLYRFATYQIDINQDVLRLVTTELPALTEPLALAKLDSADDIQKHPDGLFKFQYGMYVDDGLSAVPDNEQNGVHKMVASSCEAAYLLMGYPGPIQDPTLPPTMSS
jgi:hypothetical protein